MLHSKHHTGKSGGALSSSVSFYDKPKVTFSPDRFVAPLLFPFTSHYSSTANTVGITPKAACPHQTFRCPLSHQEPFLFPSCLTFPLIFFLPLCPPFSFLLSSSASLFLPGPSFIFFLSSFSTFQFIYFLPSHFCFSVISFNLGKNPRTVNYSHTLKRLQRLKVINHPESCLCVFVCV